MFMKKKIISYNTIVWNSGRNEIEYYDIMPYLIDMWNQEKKRAHKLWNVDFSENDKKVDDSKMPATFDEFKKFILQEARHQYWARCEYEVIIQDWPCQKKEQKIDVFQQIEANIDVITNIFMQNVN